MDTNKKVDLTISGFGVAPGGDYGAVRICRGKITRLNLHRAYHHRLG